MLTIRKGQMESMAAPHAERLAERLVEFLREQFPEAQDEPREELKSVVGEQVLKADSYGLKTEQQVAVYVTCAWMFGPDFDREFPAAREMLNSHEYSVEDKVTWLKKWTEAIFSALEEKG
jgi:hypothetical protein